MITLGINIDIALFLFFIIGSRSFLFFFFWLFFIWCFIFSFFLTIFTLGQFLRKFLITESPNLFFVRADLDLLWVSDGSNDLGNCCFEFLDLVAIQEILNIYPSLLIESIINMVEYNYLFVFWDLFMEKIIFFEICVWKIVFHLLFKCCFLCFHLLSFSLVFNIECIYID